MDEVLLENAVMLGRLKESRLEAQACRQEIVEASARSGRPPLGKTVASSKLVNENIEVDPIVATKKRKNKKKKRVTIVVPKGNGAPTAMMRGSTNQPTAGTPLAQMGKKAVPVSDSQSDTYREFITVTRRRKRRPAEAKTTCSDTDTT